MKVASCKHVHHGLIVRSYMIRKRSNTFTNQIQTSWMLSLPRVNNGDYSYACYYIAIQLAIAPTIFNMLKQGFTLAKLTSYTE